MAFTVILLDSKANASFMLNYTFASSIRKGFLPGIRDVFSRDWGLGRSPNKFTFATLNDSGSNRDQLK